VTAAPSHGSSAILMAGCLTGLQGSIIECPRIRQLLAHGPQPLSIYEGGSNSLEATVSLMLVRFRWAFLARHWMYRVK